MFGEKIEKGEQQKTNHVRRGSHNRRKGSECCAWEDIATEEEQKRAFTTHMIECGEKPHDQ